MRSHAFWHGEGGIVSFAISALDIAAWDLAGKLAAFLFTSLLGGKLHDRVRACASVILNTLDLDGLREEFGDYQERGFTAFKGGWGQVPEAGFGTDPARPAIAHTLRDVVGPTSSLALDVSARAAWTSSHALRMARQLEEFGLGWLEDPLHHEDHDGYRRIRAEVSTPLATGERCWTIQDYRRLVRSGGVDIILVDPGRIEGISGMKAIADDAAAERVRFVPHSWSSALNTAAALNVFAAATNGHVFEIKPNPSPMQHELVSDPDRTASRVGSRFETSPAWASPSTRTRCAATPSRASDHGTASVHRDPRPLPRLLGADASLGLAPPGGRPRLRTSATTARSRRSASSRTTFSAETRFHNVGRVVHVQAAIGSRGSRRGDALAAGPRRSASASLTASSLSPTSRIPASSRCWRGTPPSQTCAVSATCATTTT